MSLPPSSAPSGLASLGRTISAISDCEAATGLGVRLRSVMSCASHQVRLKITLHLFLDARVGARMRKLTRRAVELRASLLPRSVLELRRPNDHDPLGRIERNDVAD